MAQANMILLYHSFLICTATILVRDLSNTCKVLEVGLDATSASAQITATGMVLALILVLIIEFGLAVLLHPGRGRQGINCKMYE
jgi:hypothetical protein